MRKTETPSKVGDVIYFAPLNRKAEKLIVEDIVSMDGIPVGSRGEYDVCYKVGTLANGQPRRVNPMYCLTEEEYQQKNHQ